MSFDETELENKKMVEMDSRELEKIKAYENKLKTMEEMLLKKTKEATEEDKYIHVFGIAMFYYSLIPTDDTDKYKKIAIEYLKTASNVYHYAPASYYLGKIYAQYYYEESRNYFIKAYQDYNNEEYRKVHKTWDENVHYMRYKLDKLNYLREKIIKEPVELNITNLSK